VLDLSRKPPAILRRERVTQGRLEPLLAGCHGEKERRARSVLPARAIATTVESPVTLVEPGDETAIVRLVDQYDSERRRRLWLPVTSESKCAAANAARAHPLAGQEMVSISKVAEQLRPAAGRRAGSGAAHPAKTTALTSGMPNPEHAWFSLSDSCLDTNRARTFSRGHRLREKKRRWAFQAFTDRHFGAGPPPNPDHNGSSQSEPAIPGRRAAACATS